MEHFKGKWPENYKDLISKALFVDEHVRSAISKSVLVWLWVCD